MKIAIVTGASSGVGREFALYIDKLACCDEIWGIARREQRLAELAAQCNTPVRPVVCDLSAKDGIAAVADALAQASKAAGDDGTSFEVAFLVNAAGFGKFGTYRDMTLGEVDSMIDVNCRAAVDLTQLCLPHMVRGSRIVEVVSSASFQPLPGLNVYAASKAFMLSYTRALRWELFGTGIHTTAMCPIWMRTEFIDVARKTANGSTVKHPFPVISPHRAMRCTMFINNLNLPVASCSVITIIHRILAKFLPNPIVMAGWEGIRRI